MREVEVLSKLWHKNVVEFIGCCVELPHLAIAMQFAHKGPLSEILINEDALLGWELRMKWARETAEALQYLHSLSPPIIHRDLSKIIFPHWCMLGFSCISHPSLLQRLTMCSLIPTTMLL